MESKQYRTKEEVLAEASRIKDNSLRDILDAEDIVAIEKEIGGYGNRRKGFLGDLVERYFFEINPGNASEPDFRPVGIELKTTPIKKNSKKTYVSKERLVFSMINYKEIVDEKWETSSFLKKNKTLLLMFYLWMKDQNILDHKFKFIHFLDLMEDISEEDILQIKNDWEYIVAKIRRGEAHLLSEGDTYYLGACTKSANSKILREQPSHIPAKPRAFSLKQQYMNYLIQSKFLGRKMDTDSIFKKVRRVETIENAVKDIFVPYMGKTDKEIMSKLGWRMTAKPKPKSFKRLLVNKIFGATSNRIEELEKANVTLKVVTLEHTGTLKESISFPAFDYKEITDQMWLDEKEETMADFHLQLETKRFLFVIFRKIKGSDRIILERIKFWNFPMEDIDEAERVFNRTVDCINDGRYDELPKISESRVAHVRPHGTDSNDTSETPQGTQEVKRCFWLNAKYIQEALEK